MKLKRLYNSFIDAWHGLKYTYRHEQNFRIQLVLAFFVVVATFVFGLRTYEQIVVLFLILLIIVLELVNTIIEKFLDLLKPRLHGHVEVIKDVMAAAVFVASIGATIIGIIIFVPYIIETIFK